MFTRYLIGACAVLCSALVNLSVSAQGRLHYHGAACGKEINRHCSGVPDAHGQLLACLYQHQASLSPKCEGTVWGSMERLGKVLAKDRNVLRECDVDARQWCKETISGGGNLVSCFLRAQEVMSPQCKAAVSVEAGLMAMLTRMQMGKLKVFSRRVVVEQQIRSESK